MSPSILLRMRKLPGKIKGCRGNQNKRFTLRKVFFFSKIVCRLRDNVGEKSTSGQTTDYNLAHAHFTLGTEGYKHTLSEYVILIDFTATMVA